MKYSLIVFLFLGASIGKCQGMRPSLADGGIQDNEQVPVFAAAAPDCIIRASLLAGGHSMIFVKLCRGETFTAYWDDSWSGPKTIGGLHWVKVEPVKNPGWLSRFSNWLKGGAR